MNGAAHYDEAERLTDLEDLEAWSDPEQTLRLQRAQVHATLALAAAIEKAGDAAHGYGTNGYGR